MTPRGSAGDLKRPEPRNVVGTMGGHDPRMMEPTDAGLSC